MLGGKAPISGLHSKSRPATVFETRTLADVILIKPQHLRTMKFITAESTVIQALDFMRENNFNAAPVIDRAKKGRSRIVGLLNLFDLTIAISHSTELDQLLNQENCEFNKSLPIFSLPATRILGSSEESSYNWVFSSKSFVSEILHAFGSGIHRCVVIDEGCQINPRPFNGSLIEHHAFVLTQMDLFHFIMRNRDLIGNIAERSLQSLQLTAPNATFEHFHAYSVGRKHIDDIVAPGDSVDETTSSKAAEAPQKSAPGSLRRASVTDSLRFCTSNEQALLAFRRMHKDRYGDVTALCMVEQSTFALIGTISASDFRFVSRDNLSLLSLSCIDYVKRVQHALAPEERQRLTYLFQVTSKPSDSLLDCMKSMVDSAVHRTWLVDELSRPVSVVSISDIISKFSPLDSKNSTPDDDDTREEF